MVMTVPLWAGRGAWTSGGPIGIPVNCMAVDPLVPSILYAGTSVGIYKTTDAGGSWGPAGLENFKVSALVVDPSAPETVYAGTTNWNGNGVFKSSDGGETWRTVNEGLTTRIIFALAIAPSDPLTLYAATYDGIFKTANGGEMWSPAGPWLNYTVMLIHGMAVDPTFPLTVYAAAEIFSGPDGAVYKTVDGGGSWSDTLEGLEYGDWMGSVAVDPVAPSTVYAGTLGGLRGVLKSADGGGTWTDSSAGLSDHPWITGIVIDPASRANLYAAIRSDGVFGSSDGGATWRPLSAGLSDLHVSAIALAPSSPTTIHVGTDSGVWSLTLSRHTRPLDHP